MQRIKRENAYEYEFAPKEPALTVDQGESFVIEAEDASAGVIKSEDDVERMVNSPLRKSTPSKGNPLGGPVCVRGAEPGDLLEVRIERIEVEAQGFNCWGPGTTPIATDPRWPEFNRSTINIIEHLSLIHI